MVWAVVGHKGDKRLVKRFAEREMERVRAWRGRGRENRRVSAPHERERRTAGEGTRKGGGGRVPAGQVGGWGGGAAGGSAGDGDGNETKQEEEDAEEEMPVAKH